MNFLSVIEVLVSALSEPASDKFDLEIYTLALRLLTRIAVLTKNPECFLIVCYFQKKL